MQDHDLDVHLVQKKKEFGHAKDTRVEAGLRELIGEGENRLDWLEDYATRGTADTISGGPDERQPGCFALEEERAAERSEHLSDYCIRHAWSSEACGYQFEDTVYLSRELSGAGQEEQGRRLSNFRGRLLE